MRNTKTAFTILFSFFSFLVSLGQKSGETVDARWVITKSIQAMGGEQVLRSVKTLYTEMATEMEGRPVTWTTKEMLPNKGAFQILYQGRVVYEDWFNGTKGFETDNGEKKESSSESLADKFSRKNIFNELDYLDSSVYKIQLLEDTKVSRTACYKVRAVFTLGNERHLYIDKKTFNIIKEDRIRAGETEVSSTNYFADFRKYGDLVFYSTLILGEGHEAQKAKVTRLLINEGIAEADFNK